MSLLDRHSVEAIAKLMALACICGASHTITRTKMTVGKCQAFIGSSDSIKYFGLSKIECALKCISAKQCCGANYRKDTLQCSLSIYPNCSTTVQQVGSVVIKNPSNVLVCEGCIHFGSSSYKIISNSATWESSRDYCINLGGKLAEIETKAENDLLKSALDKGSNYWLGGHNFNPDSYFEWNSKPSEPLVFTDWGHTREPDDPLLQRCLLFWDEYDLGWGSWYCFVEEHFVCEFE